MDELKILNIKMEHLICLVQQLVALIPSIQAEFDNRSIARINAMIANKKMNEGVK